MRPRLLVHIGTPKAGSTSIQNMLHSLESVLCGKGVRFAAAARGRRTSNLAHQNLAWPSVSPEYHPRLGGWEDVLQEAQRCTAPWCVVSCENFTLPWARRTRYAGRVAALARAAGRDAVVVAYVRPQHRYLESLYCEMLKAGGTSAPFETYLEGAVKGSQFEYETVFDPWREAFGERLAVFPLEAGRMPGGLLVHFLGLLGADELAPETEALPRMNERIGAKHAEVLRLTRLALGPALSYGAVWRRLEPVRVGVPALLDGDAPFAGLNAQQVRAVTERFAASNARFARAYGVDAAGVLFREPAPNGGAARSNVATWDDLGAAERRRVREFVREAVGVDLPPGAGGRTASSGGAAPGSRQPAVGPARWIFSRLPWRVRLLLEDMRFIRTARDLPAFLRWLRWDVEWWVRRRRCTGGRRPAACA